MVRNVCVENVIKWLWDFGSLYPDHPTTPMSKCYQDMMPGVCPLPDPSLQSSSVSESLGSPCDAPPVSLSSFLVSFINQLLKWTCLHHFQHNCMHCNQSFASEKLEHRRLNRKPWAWPVMRSISRLLLWIARKILSMSMILQQRYNGRGTYGFHTIIADTLPDIENNHTGGWNVEVENGRYHLQVYFAVLYLDCSKEWFVWNISDR